MFEVGKFYDFRMKSRLGDERTISTFTARVVEVTLPLVRCERDHRFADRGEQIINIASTDFISAAKLIEDPDNWLADLASKQSAVIAVLEQRVSELQETTRKYAEEVFANQEHLVGGNP